MSITTFSKVRQVMLAALGTVPAMVSAQGEKPNIIYIMCDDMGYGDLGCYGQQLISTPNIDQMAREGMRFTQAYAGSPVSAPSRACFMTGQHSGHGYVRGNREYWKKGGMDNSLFNGRGDYWIVGQEPYLMTHEIIPELFKKAGYSTGMFGKWAGGYWNSRYPDSYAQDGNGNTDTGKYATTSSMSLPNKRGIDCFYGPVCQFQAHTYYPNFLNRYERLTMANRVYSRLLEIKYKMEVMCMMCQYCNGINDVLMAIDVQSWAAFFTGKNIVEGIINDWNTLGV